MVAARKDDENQKDDVENAAAGSRPKNLQPVLEIIPKSCYEKPAWKGLAYFARDFGLWVVGLVLLTFTDSIWLLVPLWLLTGFAVCGLFVIGHDAAHGSLFESKTLNSVVGRIAMLPNLHVFEAWVYGHNRVHHGHTVRQHFDFVWHPVTLQDWQKMPSWMKLRTRLEWSWLGAGAYYGREIWWNRIVNWEPTPKWAEKVKQDRRMVGTFIAVFFAASFLAGFVGGGGVLGGLWMFIKLFVIPFYIFLHLIGWTVYVHHVSPEIVWYQPRKWNPFKGQMEGTITLEMPAILNFFWHNIFIHIPHHVDMRIPFWGLKDADVAIAVNFPNVHQARKWSPSDYLRATSVCKLYDFENQRWTPYPEDEAASSLAN